jgi:regulatory protein
VEPGADKTDKKQGIYAEKAKALCASREYCISDITSRLESWGVTDKAAVERIVAGLLKEKFIDEQRYAHAFARDKLRYNKWGKIKIEWHLRMKGVNTACIKESIESIDEAEYKDIAEKLILAMVKTKKGTDKNMLRAKILRSMQSKGFEYAVTGEIVKRIL